MRIGIVVIGRNEGERLRRCLESVIKAETIVVYVDSGSTDGSVKMARELGVEVVELDMSIPFSAARGRNAGFYRLLGVDATLEFVQFVDGDCEIDDGWVGRAMDEFSHNSTVAVVCGRRRERFPNVSIYNRLCDIEWNTAVGETLSCGGDSMMRVSALRPLGGFNPTAIAGEEPELCNRLRAQGWKIMRIDAEMTLHDAALIQFKQWWRRQYRGGYGAMDLYCRFRFDEDPHYSCIVRSTRIWTVGWAGIFLIAVISLLVFQETISLVICIAVFLVLPLQMVRIAIKSRNRNTDLFTALSHGFFTVIGKWAQLFGQYAYLRDHRLLHQPRIIEYK